MSEKNERPERDNRRGGARKGRKKSLQLLC